MKPPRDSFDKNQEVIHLELTDEDEPLSPCPFCGGSNLVLDNSWTASYTIICACGAEMHGEAYPGSYDRADHEKAKRSAIEKWDKRR